MRGISNRDYSDLLDLAVTVQSEQPGGPPWPLLTESARTLLRGRVGAIGEFDLATAGAQQVIGWTDDRSPSLSGSRVRVESAIRRHGLDYPPVRAVAAGRQQAFRNSDLVSWSSWRRDPTYRVADENFDHCVWSLIIPLSYAEGRVRLLATARSGSDFTEREVTLARRAQPLLVQVERQARVWQRLLRERRCACGSPPSAEERLQAATDAGLTPREWTVLSLLATGMTARAIGHRLGITPSTVSKHQERLYRKLGTRDRTATVVLAQHRGLIGTAVHPGEHCSIVDR
ncbi:response regulator transcription factor [Cryptosporangium sp. NPDC051539]|uniref:response regulator transcription factor n=1 Tax=Cryptosporangium sp. NPDC051539 TaxID=3363962 RepID=UPI0037A4DEB2